MRPAGLDEPLDLADHLLQRESRCGRRTSSKTGHRRRGARRERCAVAPVIRPPAPAATRGPTPSAGAAATLSGATVPCRAAAPRSAPSPYNRGSPRSPPAARRGGGLPHASVTGRSVSLRSVRHGTPSTVVSSWMPPESVNTNRALPTSSFHEVQVAQRLSSGSKPEIDSRPPPATSARPRVDREDYWDLSRQLRDRAPPMMRVELLQGHRRSPAGAASATA